MKSAGYLYPDTLTITLPVFDDFSVISTWPDKFIWADNFTYVNTDFGVNPPTIGVATFDAIDESGTLYSNAGPYQFEADQLTSQAIRLDSIFSPFARAINVSDSVYLSFYYQPQGRGSMPAKRDSLILEFHSPAEFDTITSSSGTQINPKWHYVWSTPGGTQVDTFALQHNSYFQQVLIPITDSSRYYKNGFRFRFRNYASLANNYVPDWQSNGDQWNIDVVYLNTGRSIQDSVLKDIAFADRAPSMLKRFEAMPYRQYGENFVEEMKDTLDIKIANLDEVNQNASYKYSVQKDSQSPFKTYEGGTYTLFPFSTNGYSSYQPFSRPPVNFLYSPFENQEKIVYHTTHILTTDPSMTVKTNDTIRFSQVFSNYYAYDDGTAEAGVGLNGASGSYAIRFDLNVSDTLRGIQFYFNQVLSGSEEKYFDITVWNDSFGKPGNIIKQLNEVTPTMSDSLNTYHTYWFDSPLVMDALNFPGLIFYVGWQQYSIDNLNVGLDRYNDSHQNRFYNVDGNWQMSDNQHAGSLMIRPVVGKVNPLGIAPKPINQEIKITPNPVNNGELHIILPTEWNKEPNSILVSIFSSSGSVQLNSVWTETIDIGLLPPGLYLASVVNKQTSEKATIKFVVL
ncbi:MAG: T9SS type A sorting domain-containing protein [Bacteroidales bacterium]|nr:T9SS type A sorting domain-containing protein [Bacteroidales bacterium]